MAERDYPDSGRNHLDFWQAASGAILALFVCIHLVLEGTVILTPSLTNGIAWLLEALWIAQLSAPILLLIVAVHFYIAARKMPFRTGELQLFVRHSRALCEQDTWLWLVQVFTAIIILMGVFFHVYTVMTDLPISAARSAARLHQGGCCFMCSSCLALFCTQALAFIVWLSNTASARVPIVLCGASAS